MKLYILLFCILRYYKPEPDWYNLNVDGGYRSIEKKDAIEGVFRTTMGR
jgi:hypothetical protein